MKSDLSFFSGRTVAIATQHKKERVMAPLLESALMLRCIIPAGLNTDVLGTFSGEVERTLDPLAAAREKCNLAMQLAECDLAIANEGSFGPHPAMFFIPADDEIVLLTDKKNGVEIKARYLSTDTNFAGKQIDNEKDLWSFAQTVQFPSHGLIVRKSKDDSTSIVKGITEPGVLADVYSEYKRIYGEVFVETDMRAMYNPTRMKNIEKAMQKLVEIIACLCPQCATPGFSIFEVKPGLPCSWCGRPTKSALSHILQCQKCHFKQENRYPNKKQEEDPMYCDFCNP